MYRLIFLNGRHKGRRLAVQQGSLLIGRDPSCQLDLAEDERVSHQHAVIEQRGAGIWIKDLGSLNPTEVNGQPVQEVQLKQGDRIEIGRTQFEFQLIEAAPTGHRRRVSQVQVLTFVAIGLVFAVQGIFMFIQFARGPVQVEPPPAPAGEELSSQELEPDLQRALTLRESDQQAAATTGASASVETEVAQLRAAVAGLRNELEDLAVPSNVVATAAVARVNAPPPAPAPAPVTNVTATAVEEPFPVREPPPPLIDVPETPEVRPVAEDPLLAKASQLLELARQDILRSNLTGADQLLERIQVMAPEYIPAYVERAQLYEKRAMLNKAGEQWALVLDRTKGTPMYAKAAAERQRLAQAEVAVSTTRKTLDERPVGNRLPRRIRIVSVDRERFPSSKEFDEMRLVRVNMKARPGDDDVEIDQVEVRAYFFDRVIGAGVVPTEGTVPEEPLRVDGYWPSGGARSVTATYILKKGFRLEEEKQTGQKRIYEGYRVQLYYRGELQDEDAQPRSLLTVPLPVNESSENAPEVPAEANPDVEEEE